MKRGARRSSPSALRSWPIPTLSTASPTTASGQTASSKAIFVTSFRGLARRQRRRANALGGSGIAFGPRHNRSSRRSTRKSPNQRMPVSAIIEPTPDTRFPDEHVRRPGRRFLAIDGPSPIGHAPGRILRDVSCAGATGSRCLQRSRQPWRLDPITALAFVLLLGASCAAIADGPRPVPAGGPSLADKHRVHQPFRGERFARTELFFGSARAGGEVTEAEFKQFLDAFITPRFPDGLTLLTGLGQFLWLGGTRAGAVVVRDSGSTRTKRMPRTARGSRRSGISTSASSIRNRSCAQTAAASASASRLERG